MARKQPTGSDQPSARTEQTPTPAEVRARSERTAAERTTDGAGDRASGAGEPATGGEWADEAAHARTSSDPRRVAPHDRSGVPSTGDNP